MVKLGIEKIGELAVVACEGRIVRRETGFKLRAVVTSLRDVRIIIRDLSEVSALAGGGLGMLLFLHRWAYDRGIRLKLFNPTRSVQDRLARIGSMPEFDITTREEMRALLADADSRYALAA